MSINIGDKKIRFMAIRVPLGIYHELLQSNMFLMVRKGHYYMCCTSKDIAIFSFLHTSSNQQDSIPDIEMQEI